MPDSASLPQELLLLEDNEADSLLVQRWVSETPDLGPGICKATTLAEAFAQLEAKDFDAVLLSLGLSESKGLATLEEFRRHSPDMPLVVLSSDENGVSGADAIASGADDYLAKENWSREPLAQSIRFAMLRRRPAAFQAPTLRDGLTGLYNLSAFGVIGEHTMHTARRLSTSVAVVVVAPLGVKGERLGRLDLTQALQRSGRQLRSSCRQSDVVSRVTVDQIAVLGIVDGTDGATALITRTLEEIGKSGIAKGVRWLSGFSVSRAEGDLTLEGLLRRAVKDLEGASRNLARRQLEDQQELPVAPLGSETRSASLSNV